MHGPIGFEPYFLRKQGYGGGNLLKLIADACFQRDIGICAITSESDQTDENGIILRNTMHDRIGYLKENYLRDLGEFKEYNAEKFGPNSLIIKKGLRTLYLINGQTPIIMEGKKRFDHLVIGSNNVPNFRDFSDTMGYCNDSGILHGLEHPNLEAHFGIGLERATYFVEECDFVEGHNAQLRWARIFSKLPVIGQYTRTSNDKAKEFARRHKKPYISNSDAHRIEDAGIASIEFERNLLNEENEERLFESLRTIITSHNFSTNEEYESLLGWTNWVVILKGYKNNNF